MALPTKEVLKKCFQKYHMQHEKRGIVYINETLNDPKLQKRDGLSEDGQHFKDALISLGFHKDHITVYRDATAKEMSKALENFHEKYRDIDKNIDCFICALFGFEDDVEIDELLSYLAPDRCPYLTGIPKLIIIQACRRPKNDAGVEKRDTDVDRNEETLPTIPIMADMLVFYSLFDKNASIGDTNIVSWFMQTLSTTLKEYGKEYDIMTLLTAVSNYVASSQSQSSDNPEYNVCRIMSTLIKELKFEPRM